MPIADVDFFTGYQIFLGFLHFSMPAGPAGGRPGTIWEKLQAGPGFIYMIAGDMFSYRIVQGLSLLPLSIVCPYFAPRFRTALAIWDDLGPADDLGRLQGRTGRAGTIKGRPGKVGIDQP